MLEGFYIDTLKTFPSELRLLVSDEIADLATRACADYERLMEVSSGRRPHTLIHGDFRLDNMMFGDTPDVDPFALLDWQLPFKANPLWDVVYFLGGSFDPEWRRAHETELLTTYHQALVEGRVAGYSLEQCHSDYRSVALILLGFLVAEASEMGYLDPADERGRQLLDTIAIRNSTMITDLRSAGFFD